MSVFDRVYATLANTGMRVEYGLDLFPKELHPGHADAIGSSPDQMEISVWVEPSLIAGAKPIGLENLMGGSPRLEIGVEHSRAANADLTGPLG
jgi:hypothetical protein